MLCTVYYYISKMLVGELMHVCVVMSTYYILLNNEDFEPLSELFSLQWMFLICIIVLIVYRYRIDSIDLYYSSCLKHPS